MLPPPVYQDILNQPAALEKVLQAHFHSRLMELKRAAQAIRHARRVVVAAIGASYSASQAFVCSMAALGIKVILEDASELLHFHMPAYDRETLFILVSRSGDTVEIARLVERLQGMDAMLIGITNVKESCLGRGCDILLSLECPKDDLISIQTWSATILVFHLLKEEVADRLKLPECRQELEAAVESVSWACSHFQSVSPAWRQWFENTRSITLLARGASLASAQQGQLLFHEMARQGAQFFSAGSFRHGPWEVVEPGFLGFIITPEEGLASLDKSLVADILRLGGRVVSISPMEDFRATESLLPLPIPALSPSLSPLVEIIPLQFFIYEFSRWKGYKPGEFRVSTPITLTEGDGITATEKTCASMERTNLKGGDAYS
jgi:glucosamine--fructose-6-phosphate aminotransferase (isomerizing)